MTSAADAMGDYPQSFLSHETKHANSTNVTLMGKKGVSPLRPSREQPGTRSYGCKGNWHSYPIVVVIGNIRCKWGHDRPGSPLHRSRYPMSNRWPSWVGGGCWRGMLEEGARGECWRGIVKVRGALKEKQTALSIYKTRKKRFAAVF